VHIFYENSIFVAVTNVYTKPRTPNHRVLPSNAVSVFKPFLVLSSCSAFGPQECQ